MKKLAFLAICTALTATAQSPFKTVSKFDVPKELRQASLLQPLKATFLELTNLATDYSLAASLRIALPHPSGTFVWAQLTPYSVLADSRKQSELNIQTWFGNE